nr:hypothetical protein [Tanacetum cinerariifolium]
GKFVFVDDDDDDGKPLKNIDYPNNLCSDDEVEPAENEMTSFLASKPMGVGYGPKGQEIPDNIQTVCNNLDIKASSLPMQMAEM